VFVAGYEYMIANPSSDDGTKADTPWVLPKKD